MDRESRGAGGTRLTDCLVTLDAGTGSGRCVIFDTHGRPLALAQERFEYHGFADPDMPLVRGFDIDPAAFWGVLAGCTRRALAQLPGDARVRGVIATSQREGCVFLDAQGEVLYAGPNLDARAAMEGLELQQIVESPRLHAITGHAPPFIFAIARWRWFRKRHDPARVAALLMLNDWITYRLSGEVGAEPSNASESMLYDVASRCWSQELIEAMEVPPGILPPVRQPGTRIGSVTAAAAAATGLPEGTPVFVGGADTECALLGSGVYQPGRLAAVLGTTTPLQFVTDRPVFDPRANLWTSCHVVPDRWVLESNVGDTGGAYRWLLELVYGASDAAAHAAADVAIAAEGLGERPVLTHVGPSIFNLGDMNPFKPAGVVFRFPMMHMDRPNRGQLLHAFVESIAYALRGNWLQLAAVTGASIDGLTLSGGMTRNASLVQLIADAFGLPVAVSDVVDTAGLGCAVLASVGAGLHPTLDDAVGAMTRTRRIDPDTARVPLLDARYALWRQTYDTFQTWTL